MFLSCRAASAKNFLKYGFHHGERPARGHVLTSCAQPLNASLSPTPGHLFTVKLFGGATPSVPRTFLPFPLLFTFFFLVFLKLSSEKLELCRISAIRTSGGYEELRLFDRLAGSAVATLRTSVLRERLHSPFSRDRQFIYRPGLDWSLTICLIIFT